MTSFNRSLADYRSRVYETYFPVANSSVATSDKATILVIEDNADHWFLIRWALLQRFPQSCIQWLKTNSDVLPYLDGCHQRQESLPRLILVDLYLPSAQQGLHVFQTLKAHPVYQVLPTFALSSSTSVQDRTNVFAHSADGYLVKPTSYQNWLSEISLLDPYLP